MKDQLTETLDYYKLRELSSESDRAYFIKSTNSALKKTLKSVGAYTTWFGMIIAVLSVLQKLGIKASLTQATAVLVTTIITTTAGVSLTGYKVIVKQMQDKQEFIKPPQQDYKLFIGIPVKKTVLYNKKIYQPKIGIRQFTINIDDNQMTRSISQKINKMLLQKKGDKFSTLLKPGQSNTKYILSGFIEVIEKNNIRVSVNVVNSKTSEIITMDSRVITDINTLQNTCLNMTKSLIKRIK